LIFARLTKNWSENLFHFGVEQRKQSTWTLSKLSVTMTEIGFRMVALALAAFAAEPGKGWGCMSLGVQITKAQW
jgi:hypothetical protein